MKNDRTPSLKERLFERYAANLSAHELGLHDVFRCPICLRLFGREALEAEITKEHIVPGSLGGRVVTLTCRDCNCGAGSDLERSLIDWVRLRDWDQGVGDKPRRGWIRVGGGVVTFDVSYGEDSYGIRPIEDLSNPSCFRFAMHDWQSRGIPPGLDVEWGKLCDKPRAWTAALRIGYLLAFDYFGYGYIMHANLQQVRDQIEHPDQEMLPRGAIRWLERWPHTSNRLVLLCAPSQLRCFYAAVEVTSAVARYFGVVLPGLDAGSLHIYDRWGQAPQALLEMEPQAVSVPFDPDRFYDPGKVGFAAWFWSTYRRPLSTWAARAEFHYDGSVDRDTTIWYGSKCYHTHVTRQQYDQLLKHFRGRTVTLGTSRQPPPESVGAWLMQHVTKRAVASYVGPILVHEGHAERVRSDSSKIRFR